MSASHATPGTVPALGKFWTVSNVLSLLRLLLAFPVAYLILIDGSLGLILGIISFGIVTDWFDGQVARWSNTVSEWGKVLDPLADKVCAVFVVLALVFRDTQPTLPFWFLGLLLLRDSLIVAMGIILARRIGRISMSLWWGKVAITAVALTVLAALLKADAEVLDVCVWVTAGLLVYAALLYLVRFLRLIRRAPVDGGPGDGGPDGLERPGTERPAPSPELAG